MDQYPEAVLPIYLGWTDIYALEMKTQHNSSECLLFSCRTSFSLQWKYATQNMLIKLVFCKLSHVSLLLYKCYLSSACCVVHHWATTLPARGLSGVGDIFKLKQFQCHVCVLSRITVLSVPYLLFLYAKHLRFPWKQFN